MAEGLKIGREGVRPLCPPGSAIPVLSGQKIIWFLLPPQSKINDLEILFQKLITFTKHLASVKLCLRDELNKYTTTCHPPDLVREPLDVSFMIIEKLVLFIYALSFYGSKMILDRSNNFGRVPIILDRSNSFWWDPNHFGQVQIKISPEKSNLNLTKMIWIRPKQFAPD